MARWWEPGRGARTARHRPGGKRLPVVDDLGNRCGRKTSRNSSTEGVFAAWSCPRRARLAGCARDARRHVCALTRCWPAKAPGGTRRPAGRPDGPAAGAPGRPGIAPEASVGFVRVFCSTAARARNSRLRRSDRAGAFCAPTRCWPTKAPGAMPGHPGTRGTGRSDANCRLQMPSGSGLKHRNAGGVQLASFRAQARSAEVEESPAGGVEDGSVPRCICGRRFAAEPSEDEQVG